MRKSLIYVLSCAAFTLLALSSCNSGTITPAQLIVTPMTGNIYAAQIGESATNTYQITMLNNTRGLRYTINVTLPNDQFILASNGCIGFYDTSNCYIQIKFAPTDPSAYTKNNQLRFTFGVLESSIMAITKP